MVDRDAFAALLYSTKYDSVCDKTVYEKQIKILRSWIKDNIPRKLYRFRRPDEYSFLAFQNDQLWAGPISSFNDALECLPCYNLDVVNKAIKCEFSYDYISQIRESIINGNVPSHIAKICPTEILNELRDIIQQTESDDTLKKNLELSQVSVVNYLNSIIGELEISFFEGIRQDELQYRIACLSENVNSSLMWGHYTDSHTGFCLEYDFSSILVDCDETCSDSRYCTQFMMIPAIAPVVYRPDRFDASSAFVSMIMNHIKDKISLPVDNYFSDVFLSVKTLLTKSSDWSYENEWRVFKKTNLDPPCHEPILHITPTAAYLGVKISAENKNKILNICQQKNIPCYQMIPQYFDSSYELVATEI